MRDEGIRQSATPPCDFTAECARQSTQVGKSHVKEGPQRTQLLQQDNGYANQQREDIYSSCMQLLWGTSG